MLLTSFLNSCKQIRYTKEVLLNYFRFWVIVDRRDQFRTHIIWQEQVVFDSGPRWNKNKKTLFEKEFREKHEGDVTAIKVENTIKEDAVAGKDKLVVVKWRPVDGNLIFSAAHFLLLNVSTFIKNI